MTADVLEEIGTVRYERTDRIVSLTINRPERRNAMTFETLGSLEEGIRRAMDDDARVVVLTGAGDQAFCAGADLGGIRGDEVDPEEAHVGRGRMAELFETMWSCGIPTIARVRGYALAGGMGLALACDMVIAADDATFGTPEVQVGLWPYMITVPMLRSMPPKAALELMLTGRRVHAAEALRVGFVNQVVPVDELDDAVDRVARQIASQSPSAIRMGRTAFYRALDLSAEQALPLLQSTLSVAATTHDAAEGVAAFMEGRDPTWQGSRP